MAAVATTQATIPVASDVKSRIKIEESEDSISVTIPPPLSRTSSFNLPVPTLKIEEPDSFNDLLEDGDNDDEGDVSMSVSSDTIATMQRYQKKKNKSSLPTAERKNQMRQSEKAIADAMTEVRTRYPEAMTIPKPGDPEYTSSLQSIDDMLKQYPIDQKKTRETAAAARKQKEIPVTRPELVNHLETMLKDMQPVVLVGTDRKDMSAEQIETEWRRGAIKVPTLTVAHFKELLKAAGKFTLPDGTKRVFHPCCRGRDKCYSVIAPIRGNVRRMADRPILRTYYDDTQTENQQCHECVLCILHGVNTFIRDVRTYSPAALVLKVPLLVPFRININTPGGWFSDYATEVNPKRWEGFVDPFPLADVSVWMWENVIDPTSQTGDLWQINAEAMFFKTDAEVSTKRYNVVLGPRSSKYCSRILLETAYDGSELCDFCHELAPRFLWFNTKDKYAVCEACYNKRTDSDPDWCRKERFEACPISRWQSQQQSQQQPQKSMTTDELVIKLRSQLKEMTDVNHIIGKTPANTILFFVRKQRDWEFNASRRTAKSILEPADHKYALAASAAAKPMALVASQFSAMLPPIEQTAIKTQERLSTQTPVTRIVTGASTPFATLTDEKFLSTSLPSAPVARNAYLPNTKEWTCSNCRASVTILRVRCIKCHAPRHQPVSATTLPLPSPPPLPPPPLPSPKPATTTTSVKPEPNFHKSNASPSVSLNTPVFAVLTDEFDLRFVEEREEQYKQKIRGRIPKPKKKKEKQTDKEATIQANNAVYSVSPAMLRARRQSGRHVDWLFENLNSVNTTIGRWINYEPFRCMMMPFQIPDPPETSKILSNEQMFEYRNTVYDQFCKDCRTQFLGEAMWVQQVAFLLRGSPLPDIDAENELEQYKQFLNKRLPLREYPHVLRWAMLETVSFEIRMRAKKVTAELKQSSSPPPPALVAEHENLKTAMYHVLQIQDCYWYLMNHLRQLAANSGDLSFVRTNCDTPAAINRIWTSKDPINELTLPFLRVVAEVYTRRLEENKKVPVQKSFSKMDVAKSQGRMGVDNNAPVVRWDWRLRDLQIQMMICSLLGNYSDAEVTDHPSLELRYNLYYRWSKIKGREDAPWIFFYWLITNLFPLVKHSTQQYMAYRIRNLLPLLDHCRELFNFDSFHAGAVDLIRDMRAFLDSNRLLFLAWGTDSECVPVDLVHAMQPFIARITKASETLMLDHIYTAKKHEFLKALHACVKANPSINYAILQPRLEEPGFVPVDAKTDASNWGITAAHFDAVYRLVKACYRQDRQPELKLVKALPFFGCPRKAIEQVEAIMFRHYQGGKINEGCQTLRSEYPYTYNICQAFASFWQREQIVQVHRLPHHHLVAQLAAALARTRRVIPETNAIALEHATIALCGTCLRLSSYVRDNGPKAKHGSEKGTINARANLHPAQEKIRLFCSDKQKFGDSSCEHTAEMRLPVIGCIVEIRGQLITVCTNQNCGMPFTINQARTAYRNGTYHCEDCTIIMMKIASDMKRAKRKFSEIHAQKFVDMPFLSQAKHFANEASLKYILGSDSDDDETMKDAKEGGGNANSKRNNNYYSSSEDEDGEEDAYSGKGGGGGDSRGEDGVLRMGQSHTFKKAKLTIEIRCDICINRPVIKKAKRLAMNAFALNACTRHRLENLPDEIRRHTLVAVKSEACQANGSCICSDLKSTCDGKWNLRSIIEIARKVAEYDSSAIKRESLRLKIATRQTQRAPRRKRVATKRPK